MINRSIIQLIYLLLLLLYFHCRHCEEAFSANMAIYLVTRNDICFILFLKKIAVPINRYRLALRLSGRASDSYRMTTCAHQDAACKPHSFLLWSSHHHLPALKSSPGCTALVHGAHPILGKPLSCKVL